MVAGRLAGPGEWRGEGVGVMPIGPPKLRGPAWEPGRGRCPAPLPYGNPVGRAGSEKGFPGCGGAGGGGMRPGSATIDW